MDARTRKLVGLAVVAVGIVLAVVGGLADQIGIGANDDGDMGGKQIAALLVGLVLIVAGAVMATVLAKDTGDGGSIGGAESTEPSSAPTTEASAAPGDSESAAEIADAAD